VLRASGLRRVRVLRGLSVQELAARAGLPAGLVAGVDRGKGTRGLWTSLRPAEDIWPATGHNGRDRR
jgi:transcriptional regulator with XRE-family HTH domain